MTDEWLSLGNTKKKHVFFGEEKTEKKNPLPRGILCDLFWDGCWWPTYQRFGDKVGSRRLNSHLAPVVFFHSTRASGGPFFVVCWEVFLKENCRFSPPKKGSFQKTPVESWRPAPHALLIYPTKPSNLTWLNEWVWSVTNLEMYSALVIRGWRGIRIPGGFINRRRSRTVAVAGFQLPRFWE